MRGGTAAFTILHGSDLHFGRPHAPAAAEDFLTLAHSLAPDLIALSGDFTQRAKPREYEAAACYLKRLPTVPLVVTPGNHDVPLYRIWERSVAPFRNYRRWIAPELDEVVEVNGAVVVSLNTTSPERAIVNGHVDELQLERAATAFGQAHDLRVLVVHHALSEAPGGGNGIASLPGARRIVDRLGEMGVEVVLFGHLHRAFVSGGQAGPGRPLLVCSGTTASDRGRGPERGKNSCNLVRVAEDTIEVIRYLRAPERDGFLPVACEVFPRKAATTVPGVGSGADCPCT